MDTFLDTEEDLSLHHIEAVTVNHNTSRYMELMLRFSSRMVLHFFCVSYAWEPTEHWNEAKAQRRDALLEELGAHSAS